MMDFPWEAWVYDAFKMRVGQLNGGLGVSPSDIFLNTVDIIISCILVTFSR